MKKIPPQCDKTIYPTNSAQQHPEENCKQVRPNDTTLTQTTTSLRTWGTLSMPMKNPATRALSSILFALALSLAVSAQTPAAPDPKSPPVIDGGIGSCSADFTITDSAGAPVYAAKIKVHIAYGFMYAHKLDLEIGTNSDGKVKFTGLPRRVHQAPLEFRASKDDLLGVATFDPSTECDARRSVSLAKPTPATN